MSWTTIIKPSDYETDNPLGMRIDSVDTDSVTIENVTFENVLRAVQVQSTSGSEIPFNGCTAINVDFGFLLFDADAAFLTDNFVKDASTGYKW